MPHELVVCPLCGRRVYRQTPTSRQSRALEKAVDAIGYSDADDLELEPDSRLNDELDLSL